VGHHFDFPVVYGRFARGNMGHSSKGRPMDRMAAMETFVRVVDAGSFSGAAKQLRLGQPAVSKTIAQLEERLGVRLLLRSTHGLKPTVAGQNFYERAKRAIEEAEGAELAARGAGATLSGRLRICAPVTFARLHVIPHLPLFLAEHPALDVDVLLSDAPKDLIEGGIDVALRLGELADSSFTARRSGKANGASWPPLSISRRWVFRKHLLIWRSTRPLSMTNPQVERHGRSGAEPPKCRLPSRVAFVSTLRKVFGRECLPG
jgi:DNA-binding transcriptional LysR family regulator